MNTEEITRLQNMHLQTLESIYKILKDYCHNTDSEYIAGLQLSIDIIRSIIDVKKNKKNYIK
jgi:hypothetical protein